MQIFTMASEHESCEMFLPDTTSEKAEKAVIFTKKKLILLMVLTILILGILIIPIYLHFVHSNQEKIVLTINNLTKIIADIEKMKTNENESTKIYALI